MATSSDARAVKSLNTSPGRRRFVFKNFSQRVNEIDIDVYRSLVPLKAEPSEGSTFFLDCLTEYRELNTAEEFISFYEEMFPLVQTLPQIILQKDFIISNLISRLKMKGRLSHEPLLRLISALSRDLLKDFIPFLQRIADTFENLLECGADRDPEIIEQLFTCWSYIMMYLQKELTANVDLVLRVTEKLRYYSKDYIREFMAESVSFVLRKTPPKIISKSLWLKNVIREIMIEVPKGPSEIRKSGAAALLSHILRITSSRLHSNAKTLIPQLVDDCSGTGDQNVEGPGSDTVLEILILVFQRLYAELDHAELTFIRNYVCGKITDCATHENSLNLSHLLTLLISFVQNDYQGKLPDYKPMVELVGLLVQTFVVPVLTNTTVDENSVVIGKILQLMLCVLDGLSASKNMSALLGVSSQWQLIFDLKSQVLLNFIKDLLMKDSCIFHVFEINIISALINLIEISEEEVVNLMIHVCDKLEGKRSSFLSAKPKELSRIQVFLEGKIIEVVEGNLSSFQFQQNRQVGCRREFVLWGVLRCYSHFADAQANPSLLMDLINALEKQAQKNVIFKFEDFPDNTWHSLIGAALHCYPMLVSRKNVTLNDYELTEFMDLAKRYKSSPQILSAVADILDSFYGSDSQVDTRGQLYLPEHVAGKVLNALEIFSENLSLVTNKEIRISTLRILCHFEPLHCDLSANGFPVEGKSGTDVSAVFHVEHPNNNVLNILRSIETTPVSIATSRTVNLLISKIQMSLSAHRVPDPYIPIVLDGIIGIFHNKFSQLWSPASECLAILIGQYFRMIWDRYVKCLDHFQSDFLTSCNQCGGRKQNINEDTGGLVGRFSSAVFPLSDTTPSGTVLSLLIQSLQKVPSVVESHSRDIVPLFFKFLGYNVEELTSVASWTLDHKGKEWKAVLKEWLSLFRLLPNPKAFYQSQFLKDILQNRLLDENDADLQMKVLDCLLNWRDDFLRPYSENLKNLVNAKCLREELTRWSLSSNSMNPIDVQHRVYTVPIVIRILIPKVRNLKTLASQKNASVYHRKAVLGFLAQLDIDELPLFFGLLIKPLLYSPQGNDKVSQRLWTSSESLKDKVETYNVLKLFTIDTIKALSWKKRYGFLHVVEDIFSVFDESHLNPFLDLLTNCVVRILASCTSSLGDPESSGSSSVQSFPNSDLDAVECDEDVEDEAEAKEQKQVKTSVKQFKDLRSLCLKIICLALSKYEGHDFGGEFWDLFFTSIKPLIGNFKQEGASSKHPSSLFNCFLAMSKSYRLLPLLYKESNLIPDIFSILAVPSASESVLSCVFKFIKNIIKLDSELGSEDSSVKGLLLPHLSVLMCSLHSIFTKDNATKRKLVMFPSKREFTIFKLLSTYPMEPSEAQMFIDILLPLLTKRNKNNDTCVDVLQIIRHMVTVLGSGSSKNVLKAVTPLLISADSVVRTSICDVLDTLAVYDSSVLTVAGNLRGLNATSEMEMDDGLDYDKVVCAYDKINVDFFNTIPEEQAMLILAHTIHDMSSQELILRQSALRLLLSFVEFSGQILNGSLKSDLGWSESNIHHIVNNFLFNHMGKAMDKEPPVQKAWLDLLREMVLKLPRVSNLDSYKALCSDAGQDFFNNIVHLQKHRRARAVSRFKSIVSSDNLSEVITNKVFVPLFFRMLFDVQDGKDEHIRSACIGALASISGCMKWNQYYSLLIRCFRELTLKADKQKILLRLICSIFDHFHFEKTSVVHEASVSTCDTPDPYVIGTNSSLSCRESSISAEVHVVQKRLQENILPKIQKLLTSDSDNINVTISLVALKLLKLLPGEIMESQLPSIIHRISNFLKNRLESVRDEARSALAACLKELGLEYLQFIVKVLKGTLKRGFELHVLGYTLNFMLSKFLMNPIQGKLDYCLVDLLSVVENDILGGVSEEKEVEKIASKMKETRKQKSYETLKLIAQSITFKSHALQLLSPVTVHLQKQLTQKVKSKLENMLNHIAAGIECNPSVDRTELFIFTYGLIEDGINDEGKEHENASVSLPNKLDRDSDGSLISIDRRFSHLITAFALGLLQNYMKNLKLNKEDGQLLSLLDPFVKKLGLCLSSKYENIIISALRCLTLLVRLPLPSLQSQAEKIKNSLFVIAQGSVNASNQLTESCIKLLTTLLRSTKATLSADQLHQLIQFPVFVDLAKNPSGVALSLLKAIVDRRLVVPEIYDTVKTVAELMVQSHLESIRKKCSQIFLRFLLAYYTSEKRLQEHLNFLLANLRYEHSTGREAVLEMIHAIIIKSPEIVDAQSQNFFIHLIVCLANDDDSKVRSMTAAAIKCLIGHLKPDALHSILEYCLSWYVCENQNLWGAAAQALGLLVEVIGKKFEKHLSNVLRSMRSILVSDVSTLTSGQQKLTDKTVIPLWKEKYYSLVMFEKILHQFQNLFFDQGLEDVWGIICEFLLHPHSWLRSISNRILSLYYVAVTNTSRDIQEMPSESFFLMKPSRLFFAAVSFCCQLKAPSIDNSVGTLIMQNLVHTVSGLHSFFRNNQSMSASEFWSNLEQAEQNLFIRGFNVLDPRKGRRILSSLTSGLSVQQHNNQLEHPFISYLLQRMGKISFQMGATQMRILFNCYKLMSPELVGFYGSSSTLIADEDSHGYAYQMLLPLYRVSEGYTGNVVTDDLKQLAQDISESIRDIIGMQNYVQVNSLIRKNLKFKREKRKQEEKIMAVVNPVRNAKRKLRIAAKHQANKKRKIISMKMGRWIR